MKRRILALIMVLCLVLSAIPVGAAASYRQDKISGKYRQPGDFLGGVGTVELLNDENGMHTAIISKSGKILKEFIGVEAQVALSPFGTYYYTTPYAGPGNVEAGWGNVNTGETKVIPPDADGAELIWIGTDYTWENTFHWVEFRADSDRSDYEVLTFNHYENSSFKPLSYLYDNWGNRVHNKAISWLYDRGNLYLEVGYFDGTRAFINRQTWAVSDKPVAGCYDNAGGLGAKKISEDEYGVYNDKGQLQFTYTSADWENRVWEMDWHDGVAVVYKTVNGRKVYGLIDTQGNLVLPMEYAYLCNAEDGVIRAARYDYSVGSDHSYGLIDVRGNVLHDFTLGYIEPFQNGVAAWRTPYEYVGGYLDRNGQEIPLTGDQERVLYHPGFNMLGEYNVVAKEDGKLMNDPDMNGNYKYLADAKGNRISDYYRYIGPMSEGLALVYQGENGKEKLGFIDATGRVVIPLKYTHPRNATKYNGFTNLDLPVFTGGVVTLSVGNQGYVIHNPLMTEGVTAKKNAAKLLVNGEVVNVDAYNVGGSNYFKLRDVAAMLTGSEKQFNVIYNAGKKCVEIKRLTTYTPTASDLLTGGADTVNAKFAEPVVYADGTMVNVYDHDGCLVEGLRAYNIGGSNYFKLRDLGQFIDFNVGYSNTEKCISIDTAKSYR